MAPTQQSRFDKSSFNTLRNASYWPKHKHLPNHFANIGRNEISNELLHVVVNGATFLYSGDNAREIVVDKDHVWRAFRYSGSTAHSNSDLGLLQGGGVVHSIAGLEQENRMFARLREKEGFAPSGTEVFILSMAP